jgi:hypothetical protein
LHRYLLSTSTRSGMWLIDGGHERATPVMVLTGSRNDQTI